MISISAENLSLRYRIREKLTLAPRDRRIKTATGGNIGAEGRKRFVQALDDVSFSIQSGDRVGLVGSNGAGKTTLLKLLYGVFKPSQGQLNVNGRVDALFNIRLGFRPEASGRRNIELRCLINGWSRDEIEAQMDAIVEFSELGEFIDLPLKAYSQGMAARLAFSAATAVEPEILLMDEWIGAGDTAFQAKATERMNALTEKAGIIILASHNNKLVRDTCNKVLHLEKGRVKAFTSISEWEG